MRRLAEKLSGKRGRPRKNMSYLEHVDSDDLDVDADEMEEEIVGAPGSEIPWIAECVKPPVARECGTACQARTAVMCCTRRPGGGS